MSSWCARSAFQERKKSRWGAITSTGMRQLTQEIVEAFGVPESGVEQFRVNSQEDLARCQRLYRADRSVPAVQDRTVILVDDGMATRATMQVAVARLRQEHPARIIVAVPVASAAACKKLPPWLMQESACRYQNVFIVLGAGIATSRQ